MKNLEITGMPNKELVSSYREEKTRYQKMKFQNAIASVEHPHQLKEARKTIARMLTELNKRRIEAETQAYVKKMSEEI